MTIRPTFVVSVLSVLVGNFCTGATAAEKAATEPAGALAPFRRYDGEAREVKLPGTIADVVLAGGGRYVLLYLKSMSKIAVYDVNQVKIARYLPVTTDDAALAAGAEKLIVVNTTQNVIERWSLFTWERETVQPLPVSGVFKTMCMGYASQGPLLMHWAAGSDALSGASYTFIDLETLQPVPGLEKVRGRNTSYRDYVHMRASATGQVFGLWATSHSPQGLETLSLMGNRVEQRSEHRSAGHICPNADGSVVLTGGGMYTIDLRRKGRPLSMPSVPSTHPQFFATIPAEPGRQHNLGRDPFSGQAAAACLVETGERIADLPMGQLGKGEGTSWARHDFTVDKRLIWITQADQVVTVPYTNDRLLVSPFHLGEALRQSDVDFLFVSSLPPRTATRGQKLEYQMAVRSSAASVALELSAAPKGMTMSDSGKISWPVPPDWEDDIVFVIVTVTTDDNQTAFHTFRLDIR